MFEQPQIRVLCLEDDAGLARLLQRKLERVGYAVDLACDGEEGLALYNTNSYDVLAVDYNIPVHDGLEVIRILTSQGALPPTVMITAHGDEKLAVEAMKLGARDYIVKDSNGSYLELLPSVIRRLLDQQRLIEANQCAVEALRESEERFRALTESASDAIVGFDRDGIIFVWNDSAQRIFGYTAAQSIGRPFAFLWPQHLHAMSPSEVARHPSNNSLAVGGKAMELAGLRNDGCEFPAEISFSTWKKGGEVFYTAIIRDITERKQSETARQAAARLEAAGTLAGGIAHQFNNLMCGVLGNAELLQVTLTNQPDALHGLSRIMLSAQRASELAQQMLAFAQGGKYQPRVLSLSETVREMLRLQVPSFPPGVHVLLDLEEDLWNVKADQSQMTQMVINFCTNAIEAIEETGQILVTTGNMTLAVSDPTASPTLPPGRYVFLSVEDTGCGMSREIQARVFEPFFTTKFPGRGLGLAAVYGIVKNHGGAISVASEVGGGSIFKVYLPAVEVGAPS